MVVNRARNRAISAVEDLIMVVGLEAVIMDSHSHSEEALVVVGIMATNLVVEPCKDRALVVVETKSLLQRA